jgi:hypothetical protein
MSRKKPKICHIGRHFIKVPQTVAWVTVNIAVWINSTGLGLAPHENSGKTANEVCKVVGVGRRIFFSYLAQQRETTPA